MRQVQEKTNVRETQERPSIWAQVWTQAQYLNLTLTIAGQCIIGASYLIGQGVWLVANCIAVIRDIILKRPAADAHTKLFQLRIAAQLYALALVVSGYRVAIIEVG